MTYVDAAVLNFIERQCRRFQQLTGRTNVWLAVQLTNLSIVMYFIWAAGLYFENADRTWRLFVTLFCTGVFLVLTRTLFKESVEASESDAYRRVARGVMNPRRLRDAQLRISFLTLSVLLAPPLLAAYLSLHRSIALLTSSLVVLTTALLYVLACDPLPPCEGKVAAWIRAMAGQRPVRVTTRG